MEVVFAVKEDVHGQGPVLFAWDPTSRHLATTGASGTVQLFDRGGNRLAYFRPKGPLAPCEDLKWDSDGTTLCVLQGGATHRVIFWSFSFPEPQYLDLTCPTKEGSAAAPDPTFIAWSRVGSQLAVGTARGEVLMVDHHSQLTWVAKAKHRRRISCGDWSQENKFAFASDDRHITVITANGKTCRQVKVKSKPTNLMFGGTENERENIVSVSMDHKTLLLYNLDDPENALELAFQQRYGHIVTFCWFRQGYVMVGFSLGYLVVISTHLSEIGREQFCARFYRHTLRDLAYSPVLHKVATAGDNRVKVVDMNEWRVECQSEELDPTHGLVERLAWSPDGTYLTAATSTGAVLVFVMEPFAAAAAFSRVTSCWAMLQLNRRPMGPKLFCVSLLVVLFLFLVFTACFFGVPLSYVVRLALFPPAVF